MESPGCQSKSLVEGGQASCLELSQELPRDCSLLVQSIYIRREESIYLSSIYLSLNRLSLIYVCMRLCFLDVWRHQSGTPLERLFLSLHIHMAILSFSFLLSFSLSLLHSTLSSCSSFFLSTVTLHLESSTVHTFTSSPLLAAESLFLTLLLPKTLRLSSFFHHQLNAIHRLSLSLSISLRWISTKDLWSSFVSLGISVSILPLIRRSPRCLVRASAVCSRW